MEVDVTSKAKKLIQFGLLGLILLALLIGGAVYFYQQGNHTLTVHEAKVLSESVPLKSVGAGTVTELVAKDGDYVKAGDVIARVSPKVTAEQVSQLEQNLALAKQSYEQLKKGAQVSSAPVPVPAAPAPSYNPGAQTRMAQALARLQRMNELYSMGAISAVKRDEAAAEYAAAKAAASQSMPSAAPAIPAAPSVSTVPTNPEVLKQAELQIKQAEAALANAKAAQQATELVAPVSGVLSWSEDIQDGAELKLQQEVATIFDAENAWIEAEVTAEQAEKIHLGQFVSYSLDGENLQGSVLDILLPSTEEAPTENETEQTLVRVSIPSQHEGIIKAGMITTLKFSLTE